MIWFPCQVPIRSAILAVKRCISAVAFGRMAGVLTSIDRSSSTFLFWNENMIFSWRILMRVVILILPVVLGWVSGVSTPSRDVGRGYSDGLTNFNSYRCMCMYAGFLFSFYWRLPLCFDTLRLPDVSGLASDEATLSPVACGGRSDCRELSSFLILFERVQHMFILYIGFERFLYSDILVSPDVSGWISNEAALAPVARIGYSDWRALAGVCTSAFFRLRVACIVKGREVWYITIMICRCGGRYGFF